MIGKSSKWPFVISALSDRGSVRERNEDYYGIFDPETEELKEKRGLLVVVTDGMGGHFAGEEASRMVVEVMGEIYYSRPEDTALEALDYAFREANRRVFDHVGNGKKGTAGTTCTSIVLFQDIFHIAHAGDSRAYIVRDGRMRQLTEDHSVVGEMVQRGLIDREEAARHPRRNVLTRAVGLHGEVVPDIYEAIPLEKGDKLLLCTDGLFSMVTEDVIESTVIGNEPQQACKGLIDEAKKNGGEDNITAVVVSRDGAES
jgi:protein phosphatase